MAELKPEYPEGLHALEMELIDMLAEKRSWTDIRRIGKALSRVKQQAKQMAQEQELLNRKERPDCAENKAAKW